jgi:uncharacterized protein
MRILKAIILATSFCLPLAGQVMAQTQSPATISVSGEGRVASNPDMATISLGVTTFGDTAAAAMATNSEELAKVMANLTAAGIEAKDIQTTGLMLNPNWSYDASGTNGTINGYTAMNMVNVRVRALDSLGGVLDAAVKDGANTLNGLTFGIADPQPVNDEARKLAVADAVRKAGLLAEAAGVKLGSVMAISEQTGYTDPSPMLRADYSSAPKGVPVAGGEVAVTVMVNMTWALAQ